MTLKEFSILAKAMKAVFTQPTFLPDEYAIQIWYSLLKDIPYEVATNAVHKYIATSRFPPTIADIRELCAGITEPDQENETEAWDIVYKAICNSSYNSETEFEKFPPAIKKAVGSASQLRAWAMDENFNAGVESSNFKKVYRQIQEQEQKEKQMPKSLRMSIEQTTQQLMI